MDSRLSLKAPEYLAGDALEAHRNKITVSALAHAHALVGILDFLNFCQTALQELAEQLRSRKAAGADNRELLDIISQLLEMKFLDPANDDCKVSGDPTHAHLACLCCVVPLPLRRAGLDSAQFPHFFRHSRWLWLRWRQLFSLCAHCIVGRSATALLHAPVALIFRLF